MRRWVWAGALVGGVLGVAPLARANEGYQFLYAFGPGCG